MQRFRFACRSLLPALLLGMILVPVLAQADSAESSETRDLVLVLDASGSMWGRMDGTEKIVVARNVLGDLIDELPEGEGNGNVALVAYGHRREGDCDDIETIVPLAPLDRAALKTAVNGLNPKGKTPLTASTQVAIDLVKASGAPATVILVSDGVETCDGDPCATVRAAREAGIDFVLHVVGFGIEEGDVAPLECAAQAGGGLYFPADDADALAAALQQAVEPPEEPDARLLVKAVGDDALVDALVIVTTGGEDVAAGRTYTHGDTNPRVFGLAAGTYDVEVSAVRIPGAAPVRFAGVELKDGDEVERVADFSGGEISVNVTSHGELHDAAVTVRRAGTNDDVTAGRTYKSGNSNPRTLNVTAGTYDVEIGSVEISGKPTHVWQGIEVGGGDAVELSHDFPAGTLKVGATAGGALQDAVVSVRPAGGGSQVAGGRTYTDAKTNPKTFTLSPGSYAVTVKPVRLKGVDAYETTVQVEAGGTTEVTASFESGG